MASDTIEGNCTGAIALDFSSDLTYNLRQWDRCGHIYSTGILSGSQSVLSSINRLYSYLHHRHGECNEAI